MTSTKPLNDKNVFSSPEMLQNVLAIVTPSLKEPLDAISDEE